MTDTPNKIEEIRAALTRYSETEVYGPLIPLAPDMARMVLEQADRIAQLEARAEAAEADRARLARLLVEALSEIKEQTSSAET